MVNAGFCDIEEDKRWTGALDARPGRRTVFNGVNMSILGDGCSSIYTRLLENLGGWGTGWHYTTSFCTSASDSLCRTACKRTRKKARTFSSRHLVVDAARLSFGGGRLCHLMSGPVALTILLGIVEDIVY